MFHSYPLQFLLKLPRKRHEVGLPNPFLCVNKGFKGEKRKKEKNLSFFRRNDLFHIIFIGDEYSGYIWACIFVNFLIPSFDIFETLSL